ncbi:acetyl-CoA acetyltransferase, partial [Streptomyces sp. NPDC002920]
MTAGSRKVAVVGVALSDCGRVDDATPYALHAQAARRALADAGLAREVVDGFASA